MKRVLVFLIILLSGCSVLTSPAKGYLVDFYGQGTTQKVFLDGVTGKEGILALDAFIASYEYGPSGQVAPDITGAVISKQCSNEGLIYHVRIQGVHRSFLKECWDGECRLVYQPELGSCIDIEE